MNDKKLAELEKRIQVQNDLIRRLINRVDFLEKENSRRKNDIQRVESKR